MKKLIVVALIVLGTTSARADMPWTDNEPGNPRLHWKPSAVTITTHSLATASILLDVFLTIDGQHKYPRQIETNPILGRTPSDLALVGYGLAAIVGTTVIWLVLPDELRWMSDLLVIGIEVPFIQNHFDIGNKLRMPFTSSLKVRF